MKTPLVTVLALFASIQFSSADLIADLVGKWRSDNTPAGVELTTVLKRLGKKGFTYKSTLITPSQPPTTGAVSYKGDGTVQGRINHGGVSASVTGTWRIVGKTFSETSVITSVVAVTNTTSKSKLISPRKIRVVSVVNGTRGVGTLTKIR